MQLLQFKTCLLYTSWQSGHEDEIFTFSLLNSITNTGLGSQFHGITFCKLIDKSTPLFINSITVSYTHLDVYKRQVKQTLLLLKQALM